jgi:hypothetical protein
MLPELTTKMSIDQIIDPFVKYPDADRKLRLFGPALCRHYRDRYCPEIEECAGYVEAYFDKEPGAFTVAKLRKLMGSEEIIQYEGPFHFMRDPAKVAATAVMNGVILDIKDENGVKEVAIKILKHIFDDQPLHYPEPNATILALAKAVYNGEVGYILADAIEDLDGDGSHFRRGMCPKGCPHLDKVRKL